MTSRERVLAAINFEAPDRLPRWDNFEIFGDWPRQWRKWKGFDPKVDPADYYQTDVKMCIGDDGPLLSQRAFLRKDGEFEVHRNSWGQVYRHKPGDALFSSVAFAIRSSCRPATRWRSSAWCGR